jgi:hypothetical protein
MKKIILLLFLGGCAHAHPATYRGTCPTDFPIKGNADSLIYHTADSPYYVKTNAEICFESEEAATKHGYRAVLPKNIKISLD